MAQNISIGVSAEFDASSVEQKINALGRKIAESNKVQFTPLSNTSLDDLDQMIKKFDQLRKIQTELDRRMKASGQGNKSVLDADWDQLYLNESHRNKQMLRSFEYGTGRKLHTPLPPANEGGGYLPPSSTMPKQSQSGGGGGAIAGMGVGVAQAGLRAAGPVGGVAAGALGTGMSAGIGAGLMGLFGGILALGVGKMVGSGMENMGKAEDNAVALDRLKRSLGDVGASFKGLQETVEGTSKNLRITYGEGSKLATDYARLANLDARQVTDIGDELKTGVGLSRAFGLDPSQGVGVMGQMRGMRVTTDTQESRRFALLIGETIGKSGAFAKAGEVMDAISSFATNQARGTLGVGNIGGFTGALSSMIGSGIPGLDPAGAGSLLMRVNAALAAGGAKGEASQFFTGRLGARRGMDVFDTQLWREGGAFSTADSTFNGDSAVARFYNKFGLTRPGGDETLLSATLGQLKKDYGNDPKMMLQATANQMGLTMSQAAAFHVLTPNQMGSMEAYAGDLTKMSASGIGNLSKVLYGSGADRVDVANSLAGNSAVSAAELKRLDEVMAGGNDETQKQVLAQLTSKYGQERTQGSDIRDSKNALDNIKTDIASKLIPLTLEMRHGIMKIAGVGDIFGTTSEDIMKKVIEADSDYRKDNINKKYKTLLRDKEDEYRMVHGEALLTGDSDKFDQARKIKEEIEKLKNKHAEDLKTENNETAAAIEQMKEAAKVRAESIELERKKNEEQRKILEGEGYESGSPRYAGGNPAGGSGGAGGRSASGRWMGNRGGGSGLGNAALASSLDDISDPEQRANLAAFLDTIAKSEGADYDTVVGGSSFSDYSSHPNIVGLRTKDGPSTAAGRYQITNTTWRGVKKKLGLTDFSPKSQDEAAIELLRQRGALGDVLKGDWEAAVEKLGDEWQSLPSGTSKNQGKRSWAYFNNTLRSALERHQGTPMPADAKAAAQNQTQAVHVSFDSPEVRILGLDGREAAAPAKLDPFVRPASPFGFGLHGR